MSKCARHAPQRDAGKHIRRKMQERIQPAKGDQGSGNEGGDTRLLCCMKMAVAAPKAHAEWVDGKDERDGSATGSAKSRSI